MQHPKFPLILMRHGRAEIPSDTCAGQLDKSLNEGGFEQVQSVAVAWPCPRPTRIFCSDLRRTVQTASIVARAIEIPYTEDSRLREIFFGDWEGQKWSDIHANNTLQMRRWGDDWVNVSPPGGENVRQLHHRVVDFFTELCALPPEPTLIVAHLGSLRALMCQLNQRPLEELFEFDFQPGEPVVVS